ncbi:DUF4259 domain-containing protein [Microbispora sp. NBC_01189]|uniref:DUF4259 domain-containing protein n=1 Tax=Microbispora sp. NBC_01189 TaxID=2903583 RepID=UPI002E16005A|nr:DUF4259 domain-containing protein [Microbispora sp. NBC_01189]
MDDEIGFLEGPFDSDEAADAVAEIEESDDVAAAMTGLLAEFLRFEEEDDDLAEAALAVACVVAARMSGIAPDEQPYHWLDRNPFAVTEELRRLAAAAFALTTGPDGLLAHLRPDWQDFLDHVEPYRKALAGEPQEAPAPPVPDLSKGWLGAYWSHRNGSLPRRSPYAVAADRLVSALNATPAWTDWWRPSGLHELLVFGQLTTGPYAERVSRGRLTAEAWIDFGHPHLLPGEDAEREVAADLHRALSAAGRHLGLASLPPLPA